MRETIDYGGRVFTPEECSGLHIEDTEIRNCTLDSVENAFLVNTIFTNVVLRGVWRKNNHQQFEPCAIFSGCTFEQGHRHEESDFMNVLDMALAGNLNCMNEVDN